MNKYRALTATEIKMLESQSCRCADWSRVQVAPDFSCEHLVDVLFSGDIQLGTFHRWHDYFQLHSGIYHAHIHHCRVGDDVLIYKVDHISNYDIAHGAVIAGVGMLCMKGTSAFGNGDSLRVICEAGGLEVRMFDGLSSQMAHLQAFYKSQEKMIAQLDAWIDHYVASVASAQGVVGRDAEIIGCRYICNVRVGSYARLSYADSLSEGTILSDEGAPTHLGTGVIADHFIVSEGSAVTDHARLYHCFVGQACRLGCGCSVEHSLFFANSCFEKGEAVSVFAAPYTVSHHQSTLLIAGHLSFMNAGSATNQSNHLYKTGPIHYGVLERGCKTGSGSYVMWPAYAGAFSLLTGKHHAHFDTSDFPFSYIIEQNGETLLIPAANLCTVGTDRDARKWPSRDKRCRERATDRIHFETMSPFVMQKVATAINILQQMLSAGEQETYGYHNVRIPGLALRRGLERYRLAVDLYIGQMLKRAHSESCTAMSTDGSSPWLDLGGMYLTESALNTLIADVESGRIASIAEAENYLTHCYNHYADDEWQWFLSFFKMMKGKALEEISLDELERIKSRSAAAEKEFRQRIQDDAVKDVEMKWW